MFLQQHKSNSGQAEEKRKSSSTEKVNQSKVPNTIGQQMHKYGMNKHILHSSAKNESIGQVNPIQKQEGEGKSSPDSSTLIKGPDMPDMPDKPTMPDMPNILGIEENGRPEIEELNYNLPPASQLDIVIDFCIWLRGIIEEQTFITAADTIKINRLNNLIQKYTDYLNYFKYRNPGALYWTPELKQEVIQDVREITRMELIYN